jgi:FtsZ-binding cell division protein ZapB
MAGRKRLYLYWDPQLPAGFRRRLEAALARLNIDMADGETVDADPEDRGVVAAVASAVGGWAGPARPDIVIQGGPGEFPQDGGALRLTGGDIDGEAARWMRLVERLREQLGLASLALPADELEVRLNEAAARAGDAEKAMATALLNEANALRERNNLQVAVTEARERIARLEQENERLHELNQSGRFAIGAVPEKLRGAVAEARETARRAELAAARATEAAATYPDRIAWGGALYSGETRNDRPHGSGIMVFTMGKTIVSSYRGDFADGKRTGLGIGISDDGLVWTGRWAGDLACGYGILEGPDGSRIEGEVAVEEGETRRVKASSYRWAAPDTPKRKTSHHVVAPALPAPAAD